MVANQFILRTCSKNQIEQIEQSITNINSYRLFFIIALNYIFISFVDMIKV